MLAIGGWKNAGRGFVDVVKDSTPEQRQRRFRFNKHAVEFLRMFDFDGLDINWEYPGARGSPKEDKYSFARWVRELKMEFVKEGMRTGRRPLILAAAVPATPYWVDQGYLVSKLCQSLDFVNVMAYDLHGIWAKSKKTGHHAGLYADGGASHSAETAVNVWKGR